MKKKWLLIMAGALVISTLAACGKTKGASKELSNENITISQYKGVEVEEIETAEVTDEDVENEIQSTLYANRIIAEVTDRGAGQGDIVTLDYKGLHNGEVFDEGTLDVEIGNSSLIAGFEEGLIGHMANDDFELNLTFPDPYVVNPDLAGQPAVFQIHITSVTSQTLPKLNDEFVKNVSEEASTVEEYRAQLKKELKKLNEKSAKEQLESAVWDKILKNTKVENYPKDEVEEEKQMIITQYKALAEGNGIEFKDFLDQMMNGMTEEAFEAEAGKVAKVSVKQDMAVELITKKEKLELSEEELAKIMEDYKTRYGFESVEIMKEAIGEKYLLKDIQLTVVKEWAAKNCKIIKAEK